MAKRNIKIFLDSNVILSGLLSDQGPPRIILDLLSLNLPFLSGCTGKYNLVEIERVLKRKLPGLFPVYQKYLPQIQLKIIPLPEPEKIRQFSGQLAVKDVPVLASAVQSGADFLVTGDKKHFGRLMLPPSYSIKIITPSEFIDLILPEIIREIEPKD
jgi:putative PIN family toxin of toxin-antitoxin system